MADETDNPEQGALFRIEGPDEDGCVWICAEAGRDIWCHNLGPRGPAAEKMIEWLGQQDYGERPADWDGVATEGETRSATATE